MSVVDIEQKKELEALEALDVNADSASLTQRLKSQVSSFSTSRGDWKKSKSHWFSKEDAKRVTREQEVNKMLDNNKASLLRPSYRFDNRNYGNEALTATANEYLNIWHNSLSQAFGSNVKKTNEVTSDSDRKEIRVLPKRNESVEKRASMVLLSIDEAIGNKA